MSDAPVSKIRPESMIPLLTLAGDPMDQESGGRLLFAEIRDLLEISDNSEVPTFTAVAVLSSAVSQMGVVQISVVERVGGPSMTQVFERLADIADNSVEAEAALQTMITCARIDVEDGHSMTAGIQGVVNNANRVLANGGSLVHMYAWLVRLARECFEVAGAFIGLSTDEMIRSSAVAINLGGD